MIAVAALGFSLFVYAGHPEVPPRGELAARETAAWLHVVARDAQPGYWIVVRGTHPGDQVVAAASAARLTHAVMLDTERQEVVEATGAGVHISTLRSLLDESVRMQLVRPRGYTLDKGRAAMTRARSHVGSRYDWLGTVGVQNDSAYYCTELCADAYHAREDGWMPRMVLHPEQLARYGDVVFDSGMRASRHLR